uniref:Secreted protein n=1 Tax=Cacopsylla melanoneura TaxID=428564 RepID=A0A8D9FC06_9HEMI
MRWCWGTVHWVVGWFLCRMVGTGCSKTDRGSRVRRGDGVEYFGSGGATGCTCIMSLGDSLVRCTHRVMWFSLYWMGRGFDARWCRIFEVMFGVIAIGEDGE